ncbi:hypothetical protein A2U01_0100387, partial [Trifolium medium]|nr:hypothetical protein [Trifolium medium]
EIISTASICCEHGFGCVRNME